LLREQNHDNNEGEPRVELDAVKVMGCELRLSCRETRQMRNIRASIRLFEQTLILQSSGSGS